MQSSGHCHENSAMMQQAKDLLEEGKALKALLGTLSVDQLTNTTNFKNWTVNKVIQHLHGSDRMAGLALKDPESFKRVISEPGQVGATMNPQQTGIQLVQDWWQYFEEMAELLGQSDPKHRLPWFGPDMGVMMFTTARQMETWAHGQEIFDLFGVVRVNSDRIRNIAVIGVKTFAWTFVNRGQQPPGPAPYVALTAPSGDVWSFNEYSEENFVEGSAVEFCHVVTQGRHIQDVNLTVCGDVAHEWMAIAQCFAGPPENPPEPGSRLP